MGHASVPAPGHRAQPRAWSRKDAWTAVPRMARQVVGAVLSGLPPPWLLGRRFRKTAAFLDEAQWWSLDRSRAYQVEQARRLCRIAQKTPFYARVFREHGF